MDKHRYSLEKGSKKYLCPGCGKKRFVPYLDTTTSALLPEQYGRCDRAINCAYHLNPYSDGFAKLITDQETGGRTDTQRPARPPRHKPPANPTPTPKPSFVPVGILKQSRAGYQQNNFVLWLTTLFDAETVSGLISRYFIGTSKHWSGATVFWQIDPNGGIRSGKIMHYSPTTGKRTKEPFNHITWVHKALKTPSFTLEQCYFGSHLLPGSTLPIALVESEKTAIIASVYLPGFIWLAVGSLTNLNPEKCRALSGRNVFLFPDLNGFELWSKKAKDLNQQLPGTRFEVSDLLESNATETERTSGLDLADYLIRFDYHDFRHAPPAKSEKGAKGEPLETNFFFKSLTIRPVPEPQNDGNTIRSRETPNTKKENEFWSLSELEQFFAANPVPVGPLQLYPWAVIADPVLFIKSHLAYLKANNGRRATMPHLERLERLKSIIEGAPMHLNHNQILHTSAA